MSEAALLRSIQISTADRNTRLWRNNCGSAWQGQVTRNPDGSITIRNPRAVHFGLCPGSADLIGLRSIPVTADMVGTHVAVFTAVEVKAARGAHRTQGQRDFADTIRRLGGRAGFATCVDEARAIIGAPITDTKINLSAHAAIT